MTTKSSKVPNRLINEKSAYLLQHAYNPVDWYPWEKEEFERTNPIEIVDLLLMV